MLTCTARTESSGLSLPPRLACAAVALVAAAFLAACGSSGDGPTPSPTPIPTASPEERAYFQELQTAMQQIRQESAALADFRSHAFDPALAEAERLSRGTEYGTRYAAFASDRQTRLSAIKPSDNVKGLHDRLTEAVTGTKKLSADLNARLAAKPVGTDSDLNDLSIELDIVTLEQRVRDACTDLQHRANSRGVDVDLSCGS